MAPVDHILQSVFGLRQFRPRQREIIEDVLRGHDVVCVMPTGAGKSLCFQLPAVMLRGLTVIVSPLISLMADQVHHLQKLKIPALFLNSSQSMEEQRKILGRLWEGFEGLLYIAPERFSAPSFQRLVPRLRPKLFVVDEAHCVSFWGHDFRPEYMRLAEVRKQFGSPATVAVTATATPQVREDMVRMLDLRSPRMHVTGFDRPNLTYTCRHFERKGLKDPALLRFLERRTGSGIIYCSTRKAVEELAALFEEKFPERTICAYHGGMDQDARRRSQNTFMKTDESIVVATNAFGMGINKPDIRFVVHYNLPGSVEAYYQEAGRAGRDGEPANCLLFFSDSDLRTQRFFIDNIGDNNPALSKEEVTRLQRSASRKLDLMLTYAETQRCRRRQILDYFGEGTPITDCGCDVCSLLKHHRYSPDSDKPVIRLRLPDRTVGKFDKTTPKPGRPLVRTPAPAETPAPLNSAGEARFERLKIVRRRMADENKWPAFCILHDRVLREVARQAPRSLEELAKIKGVGSTKAQKFGPAFLDALRAREATREPHDEPGKRVPAALLAPAKVPVSRPVRTMRIDKQPSLYDHNSRAEVVRASAKLVERMKPVGSEPPMDAAAQMRFMRLLQARAAIANAQNYPPFCILLDETLREVAKVAPRSLESLAAIPGVGPRKAARFGHAFLTALESSR